jgi:tetratricopeptide (TPR) repeat protein
MAALVSTPVPRTIRVYCPSHKVGFSTSASTTIECSSQKHTLAHDFPNESFWEYCCDCQHYWPIDAAKNNTASAECPVCERHIVRRSVCVDCKVVSVESNNAAKRKAFSISSQGVPSPACPGCMQRHVAPGQEHECSDFGGTFVSARQVCPFCDESLEPPPKFPCSVAAYLNKLPRSAVALGFEPESNLLGESTTGDFFLIEKVPGSALSIAIPKSARIVSKQDYYNTYYELFNCENPAAGEVIITRPAIVEKVESGWQLREAGFIEIKPDPVPQVNARGSETTITCAACGTLGNAEHAFCKRCGARIKPTSLDHAGNGPSAQPNSEPNAQARAELFEAPSHIADASSQTEQSFGVAAESTGSPSLKTKTILGVVAVVALFGIVLTIIASLSTSSNSIDNKLDSAIANGQVFTPVTDNAHDLYYQLKNSGASEEKLRLYRDRLLPLLTNRPFQMINELMVPGGDDPPLADWQTAFQSMRWAVELKPGDSSLLARSIYCEGRLAYLMKDEDRALEAWARAAEADKSWPLPVNGIGLIYTARKNYPAARSFYLDAIRRDSNWAYPYNNIGTAYYMEKNYFEAKGYYQKAVQLSPQWARPHSWLGDIAMKEQDYNTAIREFSSVLDANATGTKNMDLDRIRKQLYLAQQHTESED